MIVDLNNYSSVSNLHNISIVGTDNENLVNIVHGDTELTVSIDELRAAAIAFTILKEENPF